MLASPCNFFPRADQIPPRRPLCPPVGQVRPRGGPGTLGKAARAAGIPCSLPQARAVSTDWFLLSALPALGVYALRCRCPSLYTLQVSEEEKLHACTESTNSKQKPPPHDYSLNLLDYQ